MKIIPKKKDSIFLKKIFQESNTYTNMKNIIEKLNNEGVLETIKNEFQKILENEITFQIKTIKNETISENELKTDLITNSYIFKQNLKNITSFISKFKK